MPELMIFIVLISSIFEKHAKYLPLKPSEWILDIKRIKGNA
jgi:hypothetical protein